MNEKARRIKKFIFTPELFASLCSGKYEVIENALPSDAVRVGAGYDHNEDVFWVHLESQEFRETLPGALIETDYPGPVIRRIE